MKKNLFIVIALLAFLLTACSSVNLPEQGGTPATTTENTAQSSTGTATQETTAKPTSEPSGAQAELAGVSDYFPFENDVHLKYRGTGHENAAFETYVDYVKNNTMQIRQNNGGTEAIMVYTVRNGSLAQVYARGETYYKYDYTSMSDGEDILLKEPLQVGTSWSTKDGLPRSITSMNMQIETPSGTYSAIEVTTKGADHTYRDYYAKGIGLVKSEFTSADGAMVVVSDLELIEKNTPFKHTVKFFYPQFNNDRIVYLEREVEIKTNEEMKWKFQKELKTIPGNGGLTKTLTTNTQVLGIRLDDEKDTVTVDLSSDFVREMNAGAGLEGMLLKSVANTFGLYYEKGNVILTLDGKLYESGHIMLEEGESFIVEKEDIVQFK